MKSTNRFAGTPSYAVATTIRRMVDEKYRAAFEVMRKFPGYVDNGSPIPDRLKKDPAFMAAWAEVNASVADTRDINDVINKRFKKEKNEDRNKEYAERLLKINKEK